MSRPIALRDHVASGMVRAETVDALRAFGEPMVVDLRGEPVIPQYPFSVFIRRVPGGPVRGALSGSVQSAADDLLAKLEVRRG